MKPLISRVFKNRLIMLHSLDDLSRSGGDFSVLTLLQQHMH